jgi:hypothetical protein
MWTNCFHNEDYSTSACASLAPQLLPLSTQPYYWKIRRQNNQIVVEFVVDKVSEAGISVIISFFLIASYSYPMEALPDWRDFKCRNLRITQFLERKAQWDEGGGRILLGDNTGGQVVTPGLIRFLWFGVWVLVGLPFIRIYASAQLCSITTCPNFSLCRTFRNFNYWVIRGGSVLIFATGCTRQQVVNVPTLSRNFPQWALSGLYPPRKGPG